MLVTKCDICNKKIDYGEIIRVQGAGSFKSFELCKNCGKPIMKILADKKLIDNKNPDGKKTKKG